MQTRVLGCLIEKRLTTPGAYPLTLNALRAACNQATGRDPVVDYDEAAVRGAAAALEKHRLARQVTGHGGRVQKYRHLAEEGLGAGADELALLAVLMLRGPQTVGELRGRSERLHTFATLTEVEAVLARLAERGLVEPVGRRPNQKEGRQRQLVGAEEVGGGHPGRDEADAADLQPLARSDDGVRVPAPASEGLGERLDRLEREVDELRAGLAELRAELGA